MIYKNLRFPKKTTPYFYTNFVSTIDGKVAINKNGYWPLGSKKDYEALLEVRHVSDVLIHGYNTAVNFRTLDTVASPSFLKKRQEKRKNDLLYVVISNHPDDKLCGVFANPAHTKTLLVTNKKAKVSNTLSKTVEILRVGEKEVDLLELKEYFQKNRYYHILVEGGPHILSGFLKQNLIDEVFLTIAPKIIGNELNSTLTMVEGYLFLPKDVKQYQLISHIQVDEELYLRYTCS